MDASLPAQDGLAPMIAVEHEVVGGDYSISVKAMNPNPLDAPKRGGNGASVTGIYSASYLQSLSKNFVVGGEFMYQAPTPTVAEPSYVNFRRFNHC